jgi:hypothetical protein
MRFLLLILLTGRPITRQVIWAVDRAAFPHHQIICMSR